MAGQEHASSPLAEALTRVGDRWTLLVVEALLTRPRRFNDLLGQIPGIAPNILSERLKRLEREALLVVRPYSERPPRSEYALTAAGKELAGALRLLAHWGAAHADPSAAPRHNACGTPVEARRRASAGRGAFRLAAGRAGRLAPRTAGGVMTGGHGPWLGKPRRREAGEKGPEVPSRRAIQPLSAEPSLGSL